MPVQRIRGFTLIEIMITVAILAIVASVALPSYRAYIERSRLPAALDALNAVAAKMEQVFQDRNDGTYGPGPGCNIALGQPQDFDLTCTPAGANFIARATGTGRMLGYTYRVDQSGARATEAHPKGLNLNCWTTKGGAACDH
jgi:type IV pilus assembly protein PilE